MINSLMLSTAMLLGQTQVIPPSSPTAQPASSLPPRTYILVQENKGEKKVEVKEEKKENGNGEEKKEEEEEKKEADKYFLMKALEGTNIGQWMDEQRFSVSGWVASSYTVTAGNNHIPATPGNPGNGTIVWNDQADRFLMQQAWLRLERSLDTESKCMNFGFRIDTLFGTDYRYTLPRGLFNGQLMNADGVTQNLYGVDPVQFYANAWLPNLFKGTEVRVGRLLCPWGAESIEAVSSPFLSKSFAFNWSPPFTHTGVLAISNISDQVVVKYGLAGGNDVFIDPAMRLQTIGAITYTTCDKKQTLTFGWAVGNGRFIRDEPFAPTTYGLMAEGLGRNNFNSFDIVYTNALSDKLTFILEGIFSYQDNAPIVGGAFGTARWFAVPAYLQYKVTDKITAQCRVEYFDDCQGQRTGTATDYFSQTYGLAVSLTKSLIFRPEIRWDHSFDRNFLYNNDYNILSAGAELIVRY